MYTGAASGAVTIGLALFLVLMSQKPNASETQKQPPPEVPAAAKTPLEKPPMQAAVTLPAPPVTALPPAPKIVHDSPTLPPEAAPPGPPPSRRPLLKPRKVAPAPAAVEVTPLQPRPEPAPLKALPPRAPKPNPAPQEPSPEQIANLPVTETKSPMPARSTPVTVTRKTVKEGRALLKMLEIGKGPVIEIAWPRNPADRSRLFHLLTSCHGMQTAMLSANRRLYAPDSSPGRARDINRDAVSGFIRKPAGALTAAERSVIQQIKSRHGIVDGDPVRLFPRGVDAVMLGGLGQIVGPGYLKYKTIRARYQLVGTRITISDIRVDGTERSGQVALPRTSRCD